MSVGDSKNMTLKDSENQYHKMVEEIRDYAILLLDKSGTILNWNLGAEKIKGYKAKDIIGKNFRVFYQDEDRLSKLPEKLIHEATVTGRAMHEGWRVRENKEKFWGSIVITAIHNENNEVIGFSKVTRDLTERKLAEEEIKQKAQELEVRNRELEQFTYIASHDLQEPLRKIQMFSSLLEKNLNDSESAARFLEKINSSAKKMSVLITDVLQYSRLSNSEDLERVVDLNLTLENVIEDFELLIERKRVRITHAPLPVVTGIPMQLHQLFSNLLSNAIKFSSEDPLIEIEVEDVPDNEITKYGLTAGTPYKKVIFKDNGVGFDPKYGEEVFKLFKRLHSSHSGTGIGLALCKKIVQTHGGHISVSSNVGQGTTFNIVMPLNNKINAALA